MDNILTRIITPSAIELEQKTNMVTLPGSNGIFSVLYNHVALTAELKSGIVRLSIKDKITCYFIYGGIAEIDSNEVNILTDFTQDMSSISKNDIITSINEINKNFNLNDESIESRMLSRKIKQYETLLGSL